MRVDLLKHNQEAYEKVKEAIGEGKKRIAVSHATGTGKSYLIAKLFEDFSNEKKLVLVPSTYIRDQIQKLFEKYEIQNVNIMLYQKLIKMSEEDIAAMDYGVIALDEYHHDTSKVWGEKVRTLIDTHSNSIIFGTSATPIRSDGKNTIDELFEGNCASDLPLSESIAKKIVPLPKYVGALYTLDDELERLRKKVENATNTKEEKQEFYKKINAMRSQIEKSYGMPIILNKNIKDREGKYIVFCKNKKHLAEIKDTVVGWFRTTGCKNINAYEVYSDYEAKDAEYKAFCEDTSHSLHLLFCVDMLNEGLHLENISGVLLLRPTRSSIVWHQQIGRAIEANNTNIPVIIDAVNNFSAVGQGMKLMREIKDAVTKEKESNSHFNDSEFENIDTFFVLEQVLEIQEMFREIEERLEGSWDLYIKALKQYKEREGDCSMSDEYIEQVDEKDVNLGSWCGYIRSTKNGISNGRLTKEMEDQLNEVGFIWNEIEYRFEKNAKRASEYYQNYQKYPSCNSKDLELKQIALFIKKQKKEMRNKKYPEWKLKIMNKYLPDFCCKNNFELFIENAILYRKRYGHLDIKRADIIDGFPIGTRWWTLKKTYEENRLSKEKIQQLVNIGFCLDKLKFRKNFDEKLEIAQQAIKKGITISNTNRIYEDIDFYTWIKTTIKIKYENNRLTNKEIKVIEGLVNESIYEMFNNGGDFVKVVDIKNSCDIGLYQSKIKAAKDIQERFGVKITNSSICNLMNGKSKKPYKGRFMFYYATDEEIKKYLEDSKVN